MKILIKIILKFLGYKLTPFIDRDQKRRIKIVNHYNINLIIDIGANDGQYVRDMRSIGYKNKIISFEPMSIPYSILKNDSIKDDKWLVYNFGLGDINMFSEINIAGNSGSSSFLNMLPTHIKNSPDSQFIGKEQVEIKTLDSISESLYSNTDNVMLKIDVQGYEMKVLKGALKTLKYIKVIQIEMSLTPLYLDETLFPEMLIYLNQLGFDLVSLENGFSNEITGELLQVDGVFVNRKV